MTLRVNTNVPAFTPLRNLRAADCAAVDPSELVISESSGAYDLSSNFATPLPVVDRPIAKATDQRVYLGAFQGQTMDSNITSLAAALENLVASESVIGDLDFAEETAALARDQILFQAGSAVLAQSNLVTQSVLTLLG